MKALLILAHRMGIGFGVAVVVEQLARQLAAQEWRVVVGCLEDYGSPPDLVVRHVDAHPEAVRAAARAVGASVILAQTSPFFEALPALAREFSCWAWEHGDPSPAFFAHDRAERQAIVDHKRAAVYGHLAGVIADTEFLRADIGWPDALLIPLGCDHVPDLGVKGLHESYAHYGRPLRVGTLVRLGVGEARYKGGDIFVALKTAAAGAGIRAEFAVMGRGTEADAEQFRAHGITVHLSASEDQKSAYLRDLDVFVSCSLWEGFNLPLVEAQALGTVGLAFDTGAHPEVTPLVLADAQEFVSLLAAYERDRDLLQRHGRLCYHFVRERFRWSAAAAAFAGLLDAPPRRSPSLPASLAYLSRRLATSLKHEGLTPTLRRIAQRVRR